MGLHHANINRVRHKRRAMDSAAITKTAADAKVTNWDCQPLETSASVTHKSRRLADEDLSETPEDDSDV